MPDPTLQCDEVRFLFHAGEERYTLILDAEPTAPKFILQQDTPREISPGVIDADPIGTVTVGLDGALVPHYEALIPKRLRAVVDEVFRYISDHAGLGCITARITPTYGDN